MKLLHRTSPSRSARAATEGNVVVVVVVGLPKPSLPGGLPEAGGQSQRVGGERQLEFFAKALIQRKDTKK